ncbi:hypothetical protein NMY22_g2668 [Coprinellus aureogranulatus]|nr:hypothetical protein NMY22_g2668 [Coprinellus aureogranulatus]
MIPHSELQATLFHSSLLRRTDWIRQIQILLVEKCTLTQKDIIWAPIRDYLNRAFKASLLQHMASYILGDRLRPLRLSNCFLVAGIAVTIADTVHTFPDEVQLVWGTKASVPKYIFLAVRYGNLLMTLVEYLYTFSSLLSPQGCRTMFFVQAVLEVLLASLGEAIMSIRVLAFAGKAKTVYCILASTWVVLNIFAWVLLVKWLLSVEMELISGIAGVSCVLTHDDSRYVPLLHGTMLLSVTCLVAVMAVVGYTRYSISGLSRARRNGVLQTQIYEGGLLYFLMFLVFNAANIFFEILGVCHPSLATSLARLTFTYRRRAGSATYSSSDYPQTLQIHLQGVIITRIILQLRRSSECRTVIGLEGVPEESGSAITGLEVVQLADWPDCEFKMAYRSW